MQPETRVGLAVERSIELVVGVLAILKAGGEWDVISVSDLGEGVYATPALSAGVVYLRTSDAMYAFVKRK